VSGEKSSPKSELCLKTNTCLSVSMSMGQPISCRHSAKTLMAMKGITDGEIYWVMTNGITKCGMPAFKTKARDQECWRMTLYGKRMTDEHPNAVH
jgi:hypothetical protein